MVYVGKYDGYVHTLGSGRFVVGIASRSGGVSTRNPPKVEPQIGWYKIRPLEPPMRATTFEQLAADGAPTYANPNAAIKASRRVYPELEQMFPWRTGAARAA